MVEEVEEGEGRGEKTEGEERTRAEKRGGKERRKGKEKRRGVASLVVWKQKGRSSSLVDQLEQVNQEKETEKDPERGVIGEASPRLPPLPPPVLPRLHLYP